MAWRVGVFDSGIGGLTVLSACQRRLPAAEFYYLGDNGNAPYGNRSEEEITSLVRVALRQFAALGVDAVVLACNTATSVCAEEMRREFSFPIIGVEPAVRPAARACRSALVLCTSRTAEGSRLRALIEKNPGCSFNVAPAPTLAGAIERSLVYGAPLTLSDHLPRGGMTTDGTNDHSRALGALTTVGNSDHSFDGVVLGCTHYIFFRREIARFYGIPVYDGNEGTAKRLENILTRGAADHRFGQADHQNGGADHLEIPKIGQADHHISGGFDPVCTAISPVFMGRWAKINENVYKTNKCFQKI